MEKVLMVRTVVICASSSVVAFGLGVVVSWLRRKKEDIRDSDFGGHAALIGRSPLVRLRSLEVLCPGCEVLAKAENLNPSGTGKDRVALAMVEEVIEEVGDSQAILVEGSSGSTVIALAPLATANGYRLIAVVPDDVSEEKQAQLLAMGAEVRVVKPASIASPGHYVNEARRIAKTSASKTLYTNQFENSVNSQAHYKSTGQEIYAQCGGRLDAFVASAGTGGTIAGVSRYLLSMLPKTRIVLADPPGSSLFARVNFGVCYAPQQRERTLRRHRYDTITDGVGLDRITANFASAPAIHQAYRISDQHTLLMAHYLFRFEGLFLGPSSALNCLAAVRAANDIIKHESSQNSSAFFRYLWPWRRHTKKKFRLVTILCDSGQRYLSRFWNRPFLESRGLVWPPNDPDALRKALLDISHEAENSHLLPGGEFSASA